VVGLSLTLVAPAVPAWADGVRDAEWHVAFLDMARAHQIAQGDGVTIAVIDSGINGNHPDLAGNVLDGVSFVPGHPGNGWEDIDQHGTAMAGDIAAHGHGNNEGVLGIAPRAKILPLQVKSGKAGGFTDQIVGAIDMAVARGARVISLSLGTTGGSPKVQMAVTRAEQADIVVVAAVGNRPDAQIIDALAAYPGVVAAAAVDEGGNHADISVTGSHVVLSAPGVNIESLDVHNGYARGSGTSDSTAIIAGVAALVRAKYPKMSAVDVIHRLTATATDKGPKGRDDEYGYGIVNPYAALTAEVPSVDPTATPNPSPSASSPPAKKGRNAAGTGIIVFIIALAVLATIWIRRVAARYRRRIHDDDL
jgi:type VII secretion-associated serine protease mycosin